MAGLYIHIPFCHSKCAYCDFYSRPSLARADEYVDALIAEWSARCHELPEPVQTLYIGGGTPSILPLTLLERLVAGIGIGCMDLSEFTIEANPEDVTPEWVRALSTMGVNRISMGVQSLVDRELALVGRRHSAAQALDAVDIIHRNGIRNLSCDLIYGLPAQTLDSWAYSLSALLAKNPSHLSAYILSYEPGTRLYAMRMARRITEASDELLTAMYAHLTDATSRAGFEHYEISNFGMPGCHSLHNSAYWNNTPYLGLGASAHSFDGVVRRFNPSDIKRYLACPDTAFTAEAPTPHSAHNDRVVTSLRTAAGIDTSSFTPRELEVLDSYVRRGIMKPLGSNRYRITEAGWLLADAVMTDFIRVED